MRAGFIDQLHVVVVDEGYGFGEFAEQLDSILLAVLMAQVVAIKLREINCLIIARFQGGIQSVSGSLLSVLGCEDDSFRPALFRLLEDFYGTSFASVVGEDEIGRA